MVQRRRCARLRISHTRGEELDQHVLVTIDDGVEVGGVEDGDVLGKGGGDEHEKCDSELWGV